MPKQGIGGFLAHFRAIGQKRQMRGHDMHPAPFKAVTLCLHAHHMRPPTALDASLRGHCPRGHARHGWRRGVSRLSADTADGENGRGNHGKGSEQLTTIPHLSHPKQSAPRTSFKDPRAGRDICLPKLVPHSDTEGETQVAHGRALPSRQPGRLAERHLVGDTDVGREFPGDLVAQPQPRVEFAQAGANPAATVRFAIGVEFRKMRGGLRAETALTPGRSKRSHDPAPTQGPA